jgi:hypothetical protein
VITMVVSSRTIPNDIATATEEAHKHHPGDG